MNIIVGVAGSIAAYKAPDIIRDLQKKGHKVRAILTPAATSFITPQTFEVLTEERVFTKAIETTATQVTHIEWARWADMLLIAPASATTIAKCAHGIADNFLTLVYLATEAQVVMAPAMNTKMLLHPQTQQNLSALKDIGVAIISSAKGELACHEEGSGKLPSTKQITSFCEAFYRQEEDLAGKRVLITAGPTQEALDPVRFITNRSSGKMGIALAQAAIARGADVTLIVGQIHEELPIGCRSEYIKSTDDLLTAVRRHIDRQDIFIMAAAPADFKPAIYREDKIKKQDGTFSIQWQQNPDILKTLQGEKALEDTFVVGFAAESENLEENAQKKCKEKQLDLIVANNIKGENSAFASSENQAILFSSDGLVEKRPRESKIRLAHGILDYIIKSKSV